MQYQEHTLQTVDGLTQFVRTLVPDTSHQFDPDCRTIMLIHGLCEHGERYQDLGIAFAKQGWNIVIPDHRGHGRSGGTATHVDEFSEYTTDLENVRQHFGLKPERTVLLGHSMGGLLTSRYAQTYAENMSAVILSSPLLGVKVHIPKAVVGLAKVVSVVWPKARFRSRVDPKLTTRNTTVLEKTGQRSAVQNFGHCQLVFCHAKGSRNCMA